MIKSNINTSDVLKTKTIVSPLAVMFRATIYRIAALITVVLFSFLVNLGLWQLNRGEEKQALETKLRLRSNQPPVPVNQVSVPVTPVTEVPVPLTDITGLNVSAHISPADMPLIYLDNQVYEGNVGYLVYQVVKPLSQSKHLLLELGFIASDYRRDTLPEAPAVLDSLITSGSAPITGRLYTRSHNPLSSDLLAEPMTHLRIQNLNIDQLEEELGITLLPFALQPNNQKNWPLAQPWNPLPMPSKKHFGYAAQWFLMAAVFLSLMLTFFIRKWRAIKRSCL